MTVAMPFLQKLITFLWPPDIVAEAFFALMIRKQEGKLHVSCRAGDKYGIINTA